MTDAAIAAWADATAQAIGLPLDPAHRPGVLRYLALAVGMADVVFAVPVATHDETGAVFTPVGPTWSVDAPR